MGQGNVDSPFSYRRLSRVLERDYGGPLPRRVRDVLRLAFTGHAGASRAARRAEGPPYIVHPVGTARIAMEHYASAQGITVDLDTLVCIALAHDLVEDTRVDAADVEAVSGSQVRHYVTALSKPPTGALGREEQNRQFVQQIADAGPVAAYIKICDSIHNLSRPGGTPTYLLVELIEKVKDHYRPLIALCDLGDDIAAAYAKAIGAAEEQVARDETHGAEGVDTLEAALEECVNASSQKLLELHNCTM